MPSVDTARAILTALDALGVTHVLYCPGSRSAPFAYALESGAFTGEAHPVLDERGAGFVAVGLARTGALPAVIVTSGTAVAELAPAVLEASHARLPLLVLSADRPSELRGVGASQATLQSGIFGVHARASVDLEPQEPSRSLVGQLTRAVAAAHGAPTGAPGPVQINVAFRDPLTPTGAAPGEAGTPGDEAGEASLPGWGSGSGSVAEPGWGPDCEADCGHLSGNGATASNIPRPTRVMPSRPAPSRWEDVVGEGRAGLIVAGEGASERAAQWSRASGYPILAEPASGAWVGGGVTPFEQAIVSSRLAREVDTVVVTGRPTLSRPIQALLARADVRVIVVDPCAPWVDISGNAAAVVADLEPPAVPVPGRLADWTERVRAAANEAGARIEEILAPESGRTMFDLARAVASVTRGPLVLGASNPVRAFDLAVPSLEGRFVYSNRGQAGIDGTVATAVGVALGLARPACADRAAVAGSSSEPASARAGVAGAGSARTGDDARRPMASRVTAVMGDLTLCHDASSLALASATGAVLDIVVADDEGGGIFATLEHGRATSPEAYDRWFGVAQRVDYSALAAAYGLAFVRASHPRELAAILSAPSPVAGPRLIHAPIERAAHLYAAARSALN